MSYLKWYQEHAKKHEALVNKLIDKGLDDQAIIDYFDYENMQKNEPNFCPLYADDTQCHDMQTLNCYLCGCNNFRFDDEGLEQRGAYTIVSKCRIHNGSTVGANGVVHQDCHACTVPHHKTYIKKNFNTNWREIMREVLPI